MKRCGIVGFRELCRMLNTSNPNVDHYRKQLNRYTGCGRGWHPDVVRKYMEWRNEKHRTWKKGWGTGSRMLHIEVPKDLIGREYIGCKHLISTAETMKVLDYTEMTVKKLVNRGRIDGDRMPCGKYKFNKASILNYLNTKYIEGRPSILKHYRQQLNLPIMASTMEVSDMVKKHIHNGELKNKLANILSYRMGLVDGKFWTLADIGKVMNLTRERIRQLENKALRQLRKSNG